MGNLFSNNKKRLFLFFLIFIASFLILPDIQAQNGKKITSVVIDAGHGGKDPGAIGKKSKEKDVTLKIALKTGNYIKQYCPDVNVIYTRTDDSFVSLSKRVNIANHNNADVFISIHCNATSSTSPCGVETFVMGEHKNADNLEVAKLENAAIFYEDNSEQNYDGFDPNSIETYIILSLFQSEHKQLSLDLAERVQNQLVNHVGRIDRGVQQAGFLVLYKTNMPSILIETGFLSNTNDEKFLNSKDGQTYIASAIFRAFRDFKNDYDKNNIIDEKFIDDVTYTDTIIDNDKIIYKVQIESRNKKLDNPSRHYKHLKKVDCYKHNGLYKYTTGVFYNKNEALAYCKEIKNKGYQNAFVVSFKNGKRID